MVQRMIIALGLAVALCVSMATQAQAKAYEVADTQPGAQGIQYFDDIISKIPVSDDYVCWMESTSVYYLAVGDLKYYKLSDGVYSFRFAAQAKARIYKLVLNAPTGTKAYQLSNWEETGFNLYSVWDNIVYSNLGPFPQLNNGGDLYGFATLNLLCIIALVCVIRGVVEWRRGFGYY